MDSNRAQLLFVDDEPNILEMLERMLSQETEKWDAHYCQSVDEALTFLDTEEVDTIVSDICMQEKDGFDLLKAVRHSEKTSRIPVIILTGDCDRSLKRRALDLGATDLLNKPIDREDLLARVRSALRLKSNEDMLAGQVDILEGLVKERTEQLEAAHMEIVLRLAKTCEYRDDETGNHVMRVANHSCILGKALGMDSETLNMLFLTSSLHDVGKIGIPDSILLKTDKLTPEERKIIEQHTVIGGAILSHKPTVAAYGDMMGIASVLSNAPNRKVHLLDMASRIAKHHHERWDGTGYSDRLSGECIPLEARIVAVADVYDALRSKRPYKPEFPKEKAVAIIQEESGHQFDPDVVTAFMEFFDDIQESEIRFAEGITQSY